MTKAQPPPPRSRYDWLEIARRVSRVIATRVPVGGTRPLSIEEVAYRLGQRTDATLRKKLGAVTPRGNPLPRTPFTVEDLGKIAELYGAPAYWPFADWPEEGPR
jgi:hypothetical protein